MTTPLASHAHHAWMALVVAAMTLASSACTADTSEANESASSESAIGTVRAWPSGPTGLATRTLTLAPGAAMSFSLGAAANRAFIVSVSGAATASHKDPWVTVTGSDGGRPHSTPYVLYEGRHTFLMSEDGRATIHVEDAAPAPVTVSVEALQLASYDELPWGGTLYRMSPDGADHAPFGADCTVGDATSATDTDSFGTVRASFEIEFGSASQRHGNVCR